MLLPVVRYIQQYGYSIDETGISATRLEGDVLEICNVRPGLLQDLAVGHWTMLGGIGIDEEGLLFYFIIPKWTVHTSVTSNELDTRDAHATYLDVADL